MKAQHTPGPWEVADLPHAIVVRTQSAKKSKYGADRYAAIGGFNRDDPDQLAEALANARLIAAAPELLEALLECRQMLEQYERDATGESFNSPTLNAAIAKATGSDAARDEGGL